VRRLKCSASEAMGVGGWWGLENSTWQKYGTRAWRLKDDVQTPWEGGGDGDVGDRVDCLVWRGEEMGDKNRDGVRLCDVHFGCARGD
jgi:hypothetical protein